VPAPAVPSPAGDPTPPPFPRESDYFNRELSLLEFQRRVLFEARETTNPLLERAKFLAIVSSNLDEFFMIRVSALKSRLESGLTAPSLDGRTPAEELAAIHRTVEDLMEEMEECWHRELLPALAEEGIQILPYTELSGEERSRVDSYFRRNIFPVLTPLAFDPGRPFPHLSNLSLNLAVTVEDAGGKSRFARVKVPDTLPRLIPAGEQPGRPEPRQPARLVLVEEVIAANLGALFPGVEVRSCHLFHITRDADTQLQELEAADLLEAMEETVRKRRFGSCNRLTVTREMPAATRRLLLEKLTLDRSALYVSRGPLGMSGLMALLALDRPDLKFPPFTPALPAPLRRRRKGPRAAEVGLFDVIRRKDILLHHPYEAFGTVLDFLRAAVRDPEVQAIKMTLYRVGRNSPVVRLLSEAAVKGKQVTVLVEIKARFDEESNIHWARALEREGVHVIYGLLGLKTHSKVALVVRREGDGIRRYVHLATGNYNPVTAAMYTDLGYLSCDEDFGEDATDLFNYLTGYSAKEDYRSFLVAPVNMRERLEELVRREMEAHRRNGDGCIILKINALSDQPSIDLLYEASRAGVRVGLLVRGVCCLRPGVPGLSETIRVTSIVGRFLEHSRIFCFGGRGREEIFLGSADLVKSKLDRRVEVLFPVRDPDLVRHIRDEVLEVCLADTANAWRLLRDGEYVRVPAPPGKAPRDSQGELLALYT
jgi:polyphosphate kinase